MKILFGIVVISVLLMGGYIVKNILGSSQESKVPVARDNVSIVDGTQIILLTAKGGYLPAVSTVKAGMPTILRVNTTGTFDCSSAIRIPSLKVSQNLPVTGSTDVTLGTLSAGSISGNCGMGMYPFQIVVEN